MPLPSKLDALVSNFREHYDNYRGSSYNETQLRRDFLDGVLEALGWDVNNKQGVHEAFREVVHEDRLSIDGQSKAPDYCVQRSAKDKLFYVEAKKPAVNIGTDARSAYQVRRYGWSAKMPVCLLSNFAEFAVYDTSVKPSPADSASAARIFYCRYDELESLNSKYGVTNWEYLSNLFSKDAVLKGSLENIAKTQNKKGTQTVDEAFLAEIEEWRNALAVNLALRNASLTERLINFAVQKTIDRIIFLRIAEDRGIESEHILKTIADGKDVYKHLLNLFISADEKYNSGLFHFHAEKNISEEPDTLSPSLIIDDKILKDIINTLYYPAPYEFAVMPADILGSIYERFLGKVIRLTAGHRAKVEYKPEVKKAGGVYYTPEYIVDYIVRHTIGEALKDKNPKTIGAFRVLDPACGSGSFLINAYQYLLDWYLEKWIVIIKQLIENSSQKKNYPLSTNNCPLIKTGENSYKLSIQERKRILTAHIFGVDIDNQAVEVTKLSLLLKAMEGLSAQEIQKSLFHERVLPDLGSNIKCGNSLIGSDFYAQGTLDFTEDEQYRINAFDWEAEFPAVFKDGGFDAVIGNPPYVSAPNMVEMMSVQREAIAKSKRFETLYQKWDLYVPFMEQGLRFLRENGFLSMIAPYPLTNQTYAKKLRELIMREYTLLEIADLSETKVFDAATVTNCIPVIQNDGHKKTVSIAVVRSNGEKSIHTGYKKSRTDFMPDAKTAVWNLAQEKREAGRHAGLPVLGDFCYISVGMVLNSDENAKRGKFVKEDLINDKRDKIHPRKYIEAKDIERYQVKRVRYLEYDTPRCPDKLRRPTFRELYNCPKLVMNCLGTINATIDNKDKYLHNHSIYCAVLWRDLKGVENKSISASVTRYSKKPRSEMETLSEQIDLRYLLGILNSKYASVLLTGIRGGDYHIYPEHLRNLPIPALDLSQKAGKENNDKLVALVEEMLDLKDREAAEVLPQAKTVIQRQIAALDKQIDEAVYGLYGLTAEEIKMVEGEGKNV